jgi:small subunit ribosomal protein S3
MGQKVHPYGFRLGYTKTWRSRWFANHGYATLLHEDLKLKRDLRDRLKAAGISSVEVDRPGNKLRITIRTARPGIIIGRRGSEIEKLKGDIQKRTNREVYIDIQEVHRPELDAQLVSESVALQIEKRVAFRRAMRKAVDSAQRFGCKGIKVWVAGRLNGHEIARTEWYLQGRLPLQTLRADIDYGFSEAYTTYGVIGVKCWIYKGDILDHRKSVPLMGAAAEDLEPARRREARSAAERERERIRSRPTEQRPEGQPPARPAAPSVPAAPRQTEPESGAPIRPPLAGTEAPAPAGGAAGTPDTAPESGGKEGKQ